MRNRALCDSVGKRRPLHELQHQRSDIAGFFETVDRADVGMIERGEHEGFTLKPGEAIRIVREQVGEDFERDVALQLRVARSVHLAHAASAKVRDDFVGTDLGSDQRTA